MIHTHIHAHTVEYYSAIKRSEILQFAATWMDLEIITLSQSERERQISYDTTHMWNLKYDTGTSLVAQWLRL